MTLFFQVLGPKNVGLTLLIPLTFLYVGIFITGVVGNVAVCLVIVKNKSMHTATNYYLFSLAISDLMILVLGRFPASFVISYARLITEGNQHLNQSYFWEGCLETLVDAITDLNLDNTLRPRYILWKISGAASCWTCGLQSSHMTVN